MQITQWHKGTDKPVRDGVYQRDYALGVQYCKFENGKWKWPAETIDEANLESEDSAYQISRRWRGVTKP